MRTLRYAALINTLVNKKNFRIGNVCFTFSTPDQLKEIYIYLQRQNLPANKN